MVRVLCHIVEIANKTAKHAIRADYNRDHGDIPIDYFASNFISRKGDLCSTTIVLSLCGHSEFFFSPACKRKNLFWTRAFANVEAEDSHVLIL